MIPGFIAKERTVKKSYMETMNYGLGFSVKSRKMLENYTFREIFIT